MGNIQCACLRVSLSRALTHLLMQIRKVRLARQLLFLPLFIECAYMAAEHVDESFFPGASVERARILSPILDILFACLIAQQYQLYFWHLGRRDPQ
jgi:hypothetical protein